MKKIAFVLLLLSVAPLALTTSPAAAKTAVPMGSPQLDLPRITLNAAAKKIEVQVAATDEQRAKGLMFRQHMPQDEGMLFVFEQPSKQCFWMRNTLIPLQIAFIGDDGKIVNTLEMKPLDEKTQSCSTKPVRYVLEMNKGWFSANGLKAGSQLRGQVFGN
jgi:uncharacterized protein